MYPSPHQWTIPSNQTPPPSLATQPALSTTSNLTVQTLIPVPSFQPYISNMPTCAPLSSRLQNFDGTDYRYRPDQFLNRKKARTFYQLSPEPSSPEQKHIWHVRRVALVATSLDGPVSSWFNSILEAGTQDWSTFTLKLLKQFDSVTEQNKAQAHARNAK